MRNSEGLPVVIVELVIVFHIVGALPCHVIHQSLILLDLSLALSECLAVVIIVTEIVISATRRFGDTEGGLDSVAHLLEDGGARG